jgi:hypothetical protein
MSSTEPCSWNIIVASSAVLGPGGATKDCKAMAQGMRKGGWKLPLSED